MLKELCYIMHAEHNGSQWCCMLMPQRFCALVPAVHDAMAAYCLKLVQVWQEGQQVSQGLCRGSAHYGIAVCSHLLKDGQDEGCSHV